MKVCWIRPGKKNVSSMVLCFVVWWSAMCLAFRFVAPDACENYWYCTFAVWYSYLASWHLFSQASSRQTNLGVTRSGETLKLLKLYAAAVGWCWLFAMVIGWWFKHLFPSLFGGWPRMTKNFQMGWNHQTDHHWSYHIPTIFPWYPQMYRQFI